jgi:hypothetical protein
MGRRPIILPELRELRTHAGATGRTESDPEQKSPIGEIYPFLWRNFSSGSDARGPPLYRTSFRPHPGSAAQALAVVAIALGARSVPRLG